MEKVSILIVENTPAEMVSIKAMLSGIKMMSCNLTGAESLEAALRLQSHYDFDAVLLDLFLPDSQGIDTVRRVITHFPGSAVVVLSELNDEQMAVQAVRFGAQDFLPKQALSPIMLKKSVSYAIERKRILQVKADLLDDLALALKKIASLEAILPLCLCCRKILDKNNQWCGIEEYVSQHADGKEVNLVCPDCAKDFKNDR